MPTQGLKNARARSGAVSGPLRSITFWLRGQFPPGIKKVNEKAWNWWNKVNKQEKKGEWVQKVRNLEKKDKWVKKVIWGKLFRRFFQVLPPNVVPLDEKKIYKKFQEDMIILRRASKRAKFIMGSPYTSHTKKHEKDRVKRNVIYYCLLLLIIVSITCAVI